VKKSDREIMEILEAYERDGLRAFGSAALARADPKTVRRVRGHGIWAGHVVDRTERPADIGSRPR
jgi:hypothetical protein